MKKDFITLIFVILVTLISVEAFSSTLLANLESSGQCHREYVWIPGYSYQNISFECYANLEFEVQLIAQRGDILQYDILRMVGTVHINGVAEDRYEDYYHYYYSINEEHNYDIVNPASGILEYSISKQKVTYVQTYLDVSVHDFQFTYIQFFGLAKPNSVRYELKLPESWNFVSEFYEPYDACRGAIGVDLTDSVIISPNDVYPSEEGFLYNSAYPGNWVMFDSGAYLQVDFQIETSPSSVVLVIDHLSSAAAPCPGGGYSPVDIIVNGNYVESYYDPAENYEGTHSFVTDEWDISQHLQPGSNSIIIALCDNFCSNYWIRYLYIKDLGDSCASCHLVSCISIADENRTDNMNDHHTDKFKVASWASIQPGIEEYQIFRRGYEFKLSASKSYNFDNETDIQIQATVSGSEPSTVPYFTTHIPDDQWGWRAEIPDQQELENIDIYIHIPVDAPVGECHFEISPSCSGTSEIIKSYILFNPWHPQDQVYMENVFERDEYVMETEGTIWGSPGGGPLEAYTWMYNQFSGYSFVVAMHYLNDLDMDDRKDAVKVSRHFTYIGNNADGNGILEGRWEDRRKPNAYPNRDKYPQEWNNSSEILELHIAKGYVPVKYAQCWVFAGVLTTNLRTLGIPARHITTKDSYHHYNYGYPGLYYNNTVDQFYIDQNTYNQLEDDQKVGLKVKTISNQTVYFDRYFSESLKPWPFHAWVEAFMKRTDYNDRDGWQAVDATPQEISDNKHQCGPATITAVKEDLGGSYDVKFVTGEVADISTINYWMYTPVAGNKIPATNPFKTELYFYPVGSQIYTKQIGHSNANPKDLVNNYKNNTLAASHTSQITTEIFQNQVSEDLTIDLTSNGEVNFGDDLVWTATVTNSTPNDITISSGINSFILDNRGIETEDTIAAITGGSSIAPGKTYSLVLTIPKAVYESYSSYSSIFGADFIVISDVTGEWYIKAETANLIFDPISVNLDSDIIIEGNSTNCTVTWTNPFSTTLTDVVLTYIVSDHLKINGSNTFTISIGDLLSGSSINDTQLITSIDPGEYIVSTKITSNDLGNVKSAYTTLKVMCAPKITGDFNCQGSVQLEDFAIFSEAWQSAQGQPEWNPQCNLYDADSIINILDLSVFAQYWLEAVAP